MAHKLECRLERLPLDIFKTLLDIIISTIGIAQGARLRLVSSMYIDISHPTPQTDLILILEHQNYSIARSPGLSFDVPLSSSLTRIGQSLVQIWLNNSFCIEHWLTASGSRTSPLVFIAFLSICSQTRTLLAMRIKRLSDLSLPLLYINTTAAVI